MLATLRRSFRAASLCSLAWVALPSAVAQVAPGWLATYRDPALPNAGDAASACAVATNGDVYIATQSSTSTVVASTFLKYDASGTLLWTRRYAPFDAVYHRAFAAPSGGAYFVGRADSIATGASTFVVRYLDAAGNSVWTQTYTIVVGFSHYVHSVMNTAGEVVLVGTRGPNFDVFVRGYSTTGALVFDAQAPPSSASYYANVHDAVALPNGGVVAAGADGWGGFVAAFSSIGMLAWSRPIPNLAQSVAVDGVTGSVAAAESPTPTPGTFPVMHCFDSAGSPLWSDAIADPTWDRAFVSGLTFASDGALWAVGFARLAGALASHELVLRYDTAGSRTVTRVGTTHDEQAQSVLPGAAGQIWVSVAKVSSGRVRVEQLDVLGQVDWRVELGRPGAMSLAGSSGGRIVAGGWTSAFGASNVDAIVQDLDANESPDGYCTAQVNSLGCTPSLTFAGNSSASSANGFVVSVERVLNRKTGLFFYGTTGIANVPFHGGTKCVAGPLERSALLATGGSALPANDCSGELSIDFNAFASGSPALSLPGTTVYTQAWSHDPGAASTTNLSNALHFVVLP
jgi:hypothetical protein